MASATSTAGATGAGGGGAATRLASLLLPLKTLPIGEKIFDRPPRLREALATITSSYTSAGADVTGADGADATVPNAAISSDPLADQDKGPLSARLAVLTPPSRLILECRLLTDDIPPEVLPVVTDADVGATTTDVGRAADEVKPDEAPSVGAVGDGAISELITRVDPSACNSIVSVIVS